MKILKGVTAFIALTASSLTYAQYFDHFYLGAGISLDRYQVNNSTHQLEGNLNSIYFTTGLNINSYLDVEGRFGLGLLHDKYGIDGKHVDVKLSTVYGMYAKPKLGMFDLITPYALLGITRSTLKVNSTIRGDNETTSNDFSYGAGIEFNFFPMSIYLEYLNYLDNSDYKLSAINLSFSAKF